MFSFWRKLSLEGFRTGGGGWGKGSLIFPSALPGIPFQSDMEQGEKNWEVGVKRGTDATEALEEEGGDSFRSPPPRTEMESQVRMLPQGIGR